MLQSTGQGDSIINVSAKSGLPIARKSALTAVRGPKHVVTKGLTPVLDDDEMVQLLYGIDTSDVVGLRDRFQNETSGAAMATRRDRGEVVRERAGEIVCAVR